MKALFHAALIYAAIAMMLDSPAWAQKADAGLEPDRTERKLILDALRVPVEADLKTAVLFKVDQLKTAKDWAFMRGVPQRPGGRAMDYKATPYAEAIRAGAFDDWICALLRKEKGKWRVVQYVIGATDVPYDGWDREFNAPPEIFK